MTPVKRWLIDKSAYVRLGSAELSGLTVLHLDKDFALIAVVTGQAVEPLSMP